MDMARLLLLSGAFLARLVTDTRHFIAWLYSRLNTDTPLRRRKSKRKRELCEASGCSHYANHFASQQGDINELSSPPIHSFIPFSVTHVQLGPTFELARLKAFSNLAAFSSHMNGKSLTMPIQIGWLA